MKTNKNIVKGDLYVMGIDMAAEAWMEGENWKNNILGLPEIKSGDPVAEVAIYNQNDPKSEGWSERPTDLSLDKENAIIYGQWPGVMVVDVVKNLKVGDTLRLNATNGTVIELTVKRARKALAGRGVR